MLQKWEESQFPNSKMFITLIITNVFLAVNEYIRMISEGSCDTEDWSNDAEDPALPSQK